MKPAIGTSVCQARRPARRHGLPNRTVCHCCRTAPPDWPRLSARQRAPPLQGVRHRPRRRAFAKHQRSESKRPRRRQRCGRARRAIPARPLCGSRRTDRTAPEHRQHGAVLTLHPQQPVERPFRFILNVRHTIAAFGNAEIIAPGVRVLGAGDQQRPALVRRPVRVLIIVSGIMRSAAQVARRRGIVRRRKESRLAVLSGPQMARHTSPTRTRLRRRFRKARALVEEGPERLAHLRLSDVRVQREGAHRFLGLGIPHIISLARRGCPSGIEAGHVLAYTDDLRVIRPVAELVQHDRRGRGPVPPGGAAALQA